MNNIRRGFLYLLGAFFVVFGLVAMMKPQLIGAQLALAPTSIAGTSEIRSLYGAGFIGFGVVILLGLRSLIFGKGLLLAMSIVMASIVVGRLFSIVIDRELQLTVPAAIVELLVAFACWVESKHVGKTM